MNDKNIEDYLKDHRPLVAGDPAFLMETSRRLSEVEGIKQEVDRQRKHGRIALIIALVSGLVVGILAATLVFLHPIDMASLENGLLSNAYAFIEKWRYALVLLIAGCAIALGLTLGRDRSGYSV